MRLRVAIVVGALLLLAAEANTMEGPEAREVESQKELLKIQGTWKFESLEDSTKKAPTWLKKRTFFVGGPVFLVREGDKVVQGGTLRLVPWKSPRSVDAVVRKGAHEGNTMLGVYEIKGDTLKVCFDPEGEARPKKFGTKEGTQQYVAVYKRVLPPGEAVTILGKYKAESLGAPAPPLPLAAQPVTAEVQRHGDAYLVRWSVGKATAYVGVGIRKGNTLSVAWTNRGSLGVSVYEIDKGPRLFGTYTELGGAGVVAREVLTPYEEPRREARAPAR